MQQARSHGTKAKRRRWSMCWAECQLLARARCPALCAVRADPLCRHGTLRCSAQLACCLRRGPAAPATGPGPRPCTAARLLGRAGSSCACGQAGGQVLSRRLQRMVSESGMQGPATWNHGVSCMPCRDGRGACTAQHGIELQSRDPPVVPCLQRPAVAVQRAFGLRRNCRTPACAATREAR